MKLSRTTQQQDFWDYYEKACEDLAAQLEKLMDSKP
jgi:hypothetical protein